MKATVIHFETAMPALADLGLEHLVPALMGGGQVDLSEDTLKAVLDGLAKGANAKAVRRLVMVSKASAEELLEAEVSTAKEAELLVNAAKADVTEAKQAVMDFFASFGLSLPPSPGSLGQGGEPATMSAPVVPPDAPSVDS